MNKRSFLKSMLLAAVAPSILSRVCLDSFNWKVTPHKGLFVAEFKNAIAFDPNAEHEIVFQRVDFFGEWKFVTGDEGLYKPGEPLLEISGPVDSLCATPSAV
jgi:hypothetical protein